MFLSHSDIPGGQTDTRSPPRHKDYHYLYCNGHKDYYLNCNGHKEDHFDCYDHKDDDHLIIINMFTLMMLITKMVIIVAKW